MASNSKDVAYALQKYKPGEVPYEVWVAIQRLTGAIIIEIVPYRLRAGVVEVYSTKRPVSDLYFGGEFCLPGTVVNGNDLNEKSVLDRLIKSEMKGFKLGNPIHIETYMRKNSRALEMVSLYLINVVSGGKEECWFNVNIKDTLHTINYNEAVAKALKKLNY